MNKAPIPKKKPKKLITHQDVRIDNYYWLRDDQRKDSEVIKYLNDENQYTDYWFKAHKVSSNKIFKSYIDAIPKFEEGFKTKIDQYEYYSTSSVYQEHRKYYRLYKKSKKIIVRCK